MKKLKIGVIGVGNIAESHIAAYLANPNVELYAFCDINKERVENKGKRFGVTRLYTDEETMLRELPELDAVSVCVWNCNHAPCTIMALNAGKHVLCEKPMAASTKEAEEMLEAARRNHRLLQIGFVCRFGKDCAVVEDFRDQGFFGEIYYAKAAYLRRHGNPGGWFSDRSRSAGGPLIDLGVHILDLTRYLMGNPKPVSVYGAAFQKLFNRPDVKNFAGYSASDASENEICDVEDLTAAMIRYDNGAVLELETSYSLNTKEDRYEQELFGTRGGVKIGSEVEFYQNINGYMTNITLANPELYTDESHMFEDEINHFIHCILHGTPTKAPAEDGVEIMRILDAIYESARTGHEVLL